MNSESPNHRSRVGGHGDGWIVSIPPWPTVIRWLRCWMLFGVWLLAGGFLQAQVDGSVTTNAAVSVPTGVTFSINGLPKPQDVDVTIQIVGALTLLSLAPSLLILMTSFPRVIIVFSLAKNALGVASAVPNQLVVGFSLILTFFIMRPVIRDMETTALAPYRANQITSTEALDRASLRIKAFMLRQTRTDQVEFFAGLAAIPPTEAKDLPLSVVVPAFLINELRTAFQMGFLVFLPFLLIDYVVAIILMSLGLMFLPPANISLPLKILLFVLVDGWGLITKSLVNSFI
ncbi:MAG: flagellar biosynthetic protein FliP [Proteobacteria bacterium]|nr:flagellar biosynthetic protein FliP [Pseudomonadota bacterium]